MKKRIIKKNVFIWILVPIVVLAKIVRFTILSELIDNGIGNIWIDIINSNLTVSEILSLKVAEGQNGFAILFFKFFNIFHISSYFNYELLITVLFNIFLIMLLFKFKDKLTFYEVIFTSFFIAVLNIFAFTLSKDSVQMISFLLIFIILIGKSKHKYFLSFMAILATAIIFRRYYLFIVIFGIEIKLIIDLLLKNKSKYKFKIILSILIISFTYIVILEIFRRFMPGYYYELVRVRGRMTSANTNIDAIILGNSLISYGINYLLVIIRLLFPIELIFKGAKYIVFVIFQLMITINTLRSIKNYNKLYIIQKISLYLFLGFVFTSATFEPDFGSWIRHEAVLFPIFIILFNWVKAKYYVDYNELIIKKNILNF